jgi:hypothetical protein
MPLRRPTDPLADPNPALAPATPSTATADPTDPGNRSQLSQLSQLSQPPPPTAPAAEPASPAHLRATAQDLARAAEKTDRAAREILGHAHTLCETLARTLETSERRSARDTLAVLLTGLLLCAATSILATLVTLHELQPRISLLALLRILLHVA